jgi:hypothetical protein
VTHSDFFDYCEARWDFGHTYVRRLLHAYRLLQNFEALGLPAPYNESQAREFMRLRAQGRKPQRTRAEMAARAGIWRELLEGNEPTAAKIREAVDAWMAANGTKPKRQSGKRQDEPAGRRGDAGEQEAPQDAPPASQQAPKAPQTPTQVSLPSPLRPDGGLVYDEPLGAFLDWLGSGCSQFLAKQPECREHLARQLQELARELRSP